MATLIAFIDGLPYSYVESGRLGRDLPHKAPVIPGMGYSVNIHAELFAGLTPDAAGYFNEWTHVGRSDHWGAWAALFPLLRPARRVYYADRVVHKLLARRLGEIGNIPFAFLPTMAPTGKHVLARHVVDGSILNSFPIDLISYADYYGRHSYLDCDQMVLDAAIERLAVSENVLATFVALDNVAHGNGVGSETYDNYVEQLDEMLARLRERFIRRYPDGDFFIVTDHGMANVTRAVDPEIETLFPGAGRRYAYFVDSTMVRVWVNEPELQAEIGAFLAAKAGGRLITAIERETYGVTNEAWGNFIYLADEGNMFAPSFWGRGVSVAMHGYHPELPSQRAFIAHAGPRPLFDSGKIYRSTDVNSMLRASLGAGTPEGIQK